MRNKIIKENIGHVRTYLGDYNYFKDRCFYLFHNNTYNLLKIMCRLIYSFNNNFKRDYIVTKNYRIKFYK